MLEQVSDNVLLFRLSGRELYGALLIEGQHGTVSVVTRSKNVAKEVDNGLIDTDQEQAVIDAFPAVSRR